MRGSSVARPRCVPGARVATIFDYMLDDLEQTRTGFPDLTLLLWTRGRFQFVEVKGPGDQLRREQRLWFELFAKRRHRRVRTAGRVVVADAPVRLKIAVRTTRATDVPQRRHSLPIRRFRQRATKASHCRSACSAIGRRRIERETARQSDLARRRRRTRVDRTRRRLGSRSERLVEEFKTTRIDPQRLFAHSGGVHLGQLRTLRGIARAHPGSQHRRGA